MTRVPVSSILLRSVGYDAESEVLELEFQSGRIYSYSGVSAGTYEGLLSADSKGRYFNERIKGAFLAAKIR
jgi:hypothetical protein